MNLFTNHGLGLAGLIWFLASGGGSVYEPLGKTTTLRGPQFATDSVGILRSARSAQRSFERIRKRHLPHRFGGRSVCDERIGRFCMDHRGDDDWGFPEEDSRITSARERFLDSLAGFAEEIPGDRWILGQRVFYLGDAGRWDEAADLVRNCPGGDRWWCMSLEALSRHMLGDHAESEALFRTVLEGLPTQEAEAWLDPWLLADGDGRAYLDALSQEHRRAAREWFWLLSDPLYLVSANDRLTEHLSRKVINIIREKHFTPYDMSWSDDLEEILIRYGWEVGWEATSLSTGVSFGEGVWGHHHPESRQYVPTGKYLRDPWSIPAGDWVPTKETPRSGYAPTYAPVIGELTTLISVLRHGDSITVTAPYRFQVERPPSVLQPPSPEIEAGLFLVPPGVPMVSTTQVGEPEGTLLLKAPAGDQLIGVEALDRQRETASRVRYGLSESIVPEGVPVLSDLIFLYGGGDPPETIRDALPRARPDADLRSGESLGLAWDLYGLGFSSETISFRIRLTKKGGGFFDWLGRQVGVGDDDPSVLLSWSEPGPEVPGSMFRAVDLELPPLVRGEYVLRLEAEVSGRSVMVAERSFLVSG